MDRRDIETLTTGRPRVGIARRTALGDVSYGCIGLRMAQSAEEAGEVAQLRQI